MRRIPKLILPLFIGLLGNSCTHENSTGAPVNTTVQAAVDSALQANVVAMNNYDWQASADLFADDATYASPLDGIYQHGKAVLDSVMKEVTASHKKDSLKADIHWNTESLLVKDSMAYQIVEQVFSIQPGSKTAFKGKANMVITWKKQKDAKWKVHYMLSYPGS